MASSKSFTPSLQALPNEVQIHLLSYLRAFELSALQRTCRFYNDAELLKSVVVFIEKHVYSPDLTAGTKPAPEIERYNLAHLRNIELTVVARVLSLPEPKTGFYISKSWIKKTLLWLETVNEAPRKKKLNKKQMRQRARRLSDVSPPWPNANSDLICRHQKLQHCGAKAARSRRRLMDKQAWKVLKKLYPDSTQLDSVCGECLQCLVETEQERVERKKILEQEKMERKKPLSNPLVRRFYTRNRGVPTDCLKEESASGTMIGVVSNRICPLKTGSYVIIPRAWCHQWRRYMKTGEGSMPPPPDSSALLCHAHKYALIPPHLEAYLKGETTQLHSTTRATMPEPPASGNSPVGTMGSFSTVPIGVQPSLDVGTLRALHAAGISPTEVNTQRMAMLRLQQRQTSPSTPTPDREPPSSTSLNHLLDRENHLVIELVTQEEWLALQETGHWSKGLSHFAVKVIVEGNNYHFSTTPCRECDPTGSRFLVGAEVKYRRKRLEPKSVELRRTTKIEY